MLRARKDKVIVKAMKEDKRTKSGIMLAVDDSEKDYIIATVVSVGDDVSLNDLKVGNIVVFASYSPVKCVIDGEELMILESEKVLAVLEEK